MELIKENDVVIDIRELWLAEEAKVTAADEQLKVKTAKLKTTLKKKKEVADKLKLKEEIKRKKVATGERKKKELLDMMKVKSTRLRSGALLVEQSVTKTTETVKKPERVDISFASTNGGTTKRKFQGATLENISSPSKKQKICRATKYPISTASNGPKHKVNSSCRWGPGSEESE